MTAKILDGKHIAQQEKEYIAECVEKRVQQKKRPPGLAVILVGEDHASQVYVANKRQACQTVGFYSESYHYPQEVTSEALFEKITELNHSPTIDGILLQLPLPSHLPIDSLLAHIHPQKDVDGFHPYNMGTLAQNRTGLRPCTPMGIMTLLKHTQCTLKGMEACIVGASRIVGRPMAFELLNAEATVTICQRSTQNLSQHVQKADLLIVATGNPCLIQGNWIKPGAIVIDVGINRTKENKLIGDVDFENAKQRASWITPVPGGVGPMTVSSLLKNTLYACEHYATSLS